MRDARKPYADFDLYMDAVLVDAPCSGLGVIADKPDIKYRFTDAQLESLLPLQAEILENCARFVRVGGLLVYSTCTILPEENEKQVRAFLEKHPGVRPRDGRGLPARTSALPLRRRHGAVFEPPRPRRGLLHRPDAQKGRVAWSARSFSR